MATPRILAIDDDPDLIRVLTYALQMDGYEVSIALRGEKGLDLVRTHQPDLVLLDLMLPDIDGLLVLERIAHIDPEAQVVMMTGQGDIATAVRAMKLGARDFLIKPLDLDKIRGSVRALLRRPSEGAAGRWAKPIVGESPEIREVWTQVSRFALPDISVLLLGESGTGKELFARAIHERSKRREMAWVALDSATLPDTLVESELFGHEKGAFTGAAEARAGKFESAHEGTIFLDEIGNLPLPFQAKMLRVVQERYVDRLGGRKPIPVDVRLISATNLDLSLAIRKGTFREDLYYRLAEVVIQIPPLRSRQGDIERLAAFFVDEYTRRFERNVQGITDEAMHILRSYRWPGNVRELENAIKSSLLSAEDWIGAAHLPGYLRREDASPLPPASFDGPFLESIRARVDAGLAAGFLDLKQVVAGYGGEIERAVLAELLQRRRFSHAALCRFLKIDPKTLRSKLQKFGLSER